MELDELIRESKAPPPRGRKPKQIVATYERDLTRADIDALWDLPDGGLASATPPLQKLRHRHHALARLLAAGVPRCEAAAITGYQPMSITILESDPAFKELLAYYKTQKDQIFLDFHEKLKELGITCFQEIMDRLESNPEDFSNEELRELLTAASDRIGHGPTKSISGAIAVGVITSEHLTRIKMEVANRQSGTIAKLDAGGNGAQMGHSLIQKSLAEEAQILEPSEEGPGI